MLTDTHAHLYWDLFQEDFDQVINRAIDAGVTTIINVGVDVEKSRIALEQVQGELSKINGLSTYSTIGIHPHEAGKYGESEGLGILGEDISKLEEIYRSNPEKVVAVGECGLDFFFKEEIATPPKYEILAGRNDEKTKDLQRQLLQAQINLAKKLNLPLIVHCRDDRSQDPENSEAWNEVLKMVGNYPTILHCYSGLPQTTNNVLQTPNLFISFAGTITYPKNDYLREAAKLLPLNRIVLETDCPFLPPQTKRGTRNEPANVKEIAQLIAEIKGVTFEEISTQTTKNVKMIFNL